MKKVVTIGGGTGSFVMLSGLKKYPVKISAIVSMTDDGGSTGVLRDELGVLPPGDVRQCLVALSDSSEKLREIMNYRFSEGGLDGHNLGNIFLSALEKIEGSFIKGIEEAAKILNVKGEVIPVTAKDTNLFLELKNGKILKGENEINHNYEIERVGIIKNYLFPKAKANPKAIRRILEADLVIIGPGNHYCSIVPNFLVEGISEAIRKTKAKVVYNSGMVNKKGHTEKFTLDDYVKKINKLIGKSRIDFVTYNTRLPEKRLIEKYENQKEILLKLSKNITRREFKIIRADMLSEKNPKYYKSDKLAYSRSFIRHDSDKLAKVIMMVLELGDYQNIIKEIL